MSATVEEVYNSGSLGGNRAEIAYLIRGAEDRAAAYTALLGAVAGTYNGLSLDLPSVRVDDLEENEAGLICTGTVAYKTDSRPQTGDSSYEFDTSGGTEHITQSLSTVARYAPSGQTAADCEGAINVTQDSVEGVDIERAAFRWSETHYLDDDDVDAAYIAKLKALSKTVNAGQFTDQKGNQFAAGEVLFLGVKGSQRGEGDWELTFSFAAQTNRTNITIGAITGIEKKGWQYLWCAYQDTKDETAKRLTRRPIAVYVEKVYRDGDFDDLGLGGGT